MQPSKKTKYKFGNSSFVSDGAKVLSLDIQSSDLKQELERAVEMLSFYKEKLFPEVIEEIELSDESEMDEYNEVDFSDQSQTVANSFESDVINQSIESNFIQKNATVEPKLIKITLGNGNTYEVDEAVLSNYKNTTVVHPKPAPLPRSLMGTKNKLG